MTVNISEKAINQKLSLDDRLRWENYQNAPINEKSFDQFKESIKDCNIEVQELFTKAEEAGIALEFNADGTLNQKTVQSLHDLNIKYKDNAVASKLYGKAVQAEIAAEKLNVKAKSANNVATTANIAKQKAHTQALHLKAGAYKAAAAAANVFNVTMLKDIATMGAIGLAISGVTWLLTKLYETIPTENHIKEWAEEAKVALQETRDEIDSIQGELSTLGERIDELQSKGSLSFTEQEELKNLQQENAELERKLAILERVEKLEASESSKSNLRALSTMNSGDTGAGMYHSGSWTDLGTVGEQIDNYTRLIASARRELTNLETKGLSGKESKKAWEDKNKEISEYETKLTEIINEASGYISEIDPKFLSGTDLELYEETLSAINKSLYETGDMNFDTYLSSFFDSAEELNSAKVDMQTLAASSEEINKNTIEEFIDEDSLRRLKEAGLSTGDIVEHIKSLRGIEGSISNVIDKIGSSDESKAEKISSNLNAIIGNENFSAFSEDSIKRIFGVDFINQLEEAGFSIQDFISYLKEAQNKANDIDFSDALTELSGMADTVETLNDAYEQFAEDKYVDSDKLSKVAEQFAVINDSDAYKEFIETISDSNSTVEQVGQSMENLINTYMTSNDVMSNLTEQNRNLYESRLESMGVSNASEIVEYNLQKAILASASATEKAKLEATDAMTALMEEEWSLKAVGVAALDSAAKLELFAAYEQFAAGNNFAEVVSNHAEALGNVAEAAGPAAAKLKEYISIVGKISEIQEALLDPKQKSGWSYMRNSLPELYEQLDNLASDAQKEFIDLATPDIDFTPGTTADISGSSSSSSSGKTAAEKRKDSYDKAKKKLDYQLKMNQISYAEYYKKLKELGEKYLKGQKGNAQDYRDHLQDMADIREEAFNDAKDKLDQQLEDGDISITTYYNKITAAMNKWLKGFKSNSKAYKDAQRELADKVFDYWEGRIDKTQEKIDRMNLMGTRNPKYTDQWYWKNLLKDIQNSYAKGMITMEQYTELYWGVMENIVEAEEEHYENQKNNIDQLVDMVSEMLKQEAEDMIDALEEQRDKYSDIVDAKKEALQLTKDQLEYENELKDKNDELAELQSLASIYKMDQTREGQAKYNEILSQIQEKQEEISDLQSEHAFNATNDALDSAQKQFEDSIETKVDSINKEMENQGEWLQGVYDYIKTTDPSVLLQELTDYNFKYGDGLNSTVTTLWENTEPILEDNNYNIKKIVSILEDYTKEGSSSNSGNYKSRSEVYSMAMASRTRKNSDTENLNMTGDIKRYFSNAYYDPDTNVWYTNDSKKITIAAYPIIQDMKEIAKDVSISKSKKKEKIRPLLKKLKTYWGYSNAHFDYDTLHLYKTSGTKTKIFHSGLAGGFVGDGYTPSQKESYTLLTNDELVLNKKDQFRLANQIQVLETVKKAFSGMFNENSGLNSMIKNGHEINIKVDAPVVVNGNANEDTIRELDKFGKKIANETLNKLQSALGQRGYNSRTAQNALKKL